MVPGRNRLAANFFSNPSDGTAAFGEGDGAGLLSLLVSCFLFADGFFGGFRRHRFPPIRPNRRERKPPVEQELNLRQVCPDSQRKTSILCGLQTDGPQDSIELYATKTRALRLRVGFEVTPMSQG